MRGRWRDRGAGVALAGWLLLVGTAVAAEQAPVARPGLLTTADWRADLEFAREEIPRRHVAPWHSLSRSSYDAMFERLLRDADELADHEIVVRLAEIVAAIGDGHSRLSLPMDPNATLEVVHTGTAAPLVRPFRQLPLRLARTEDGYIVTSAAPSMERLLGLQVIAVDGHPIADVEEALSPIVHRDNEHQLHHLLARFMVVPEILHARGITASLEQSRWRFVDASGESREQTMSPVPPGEVVQWRSVPTPGWPVARSARDDGLWFADVNDPPAVFVRIAEITDTRQRSFTVFTDELQAHLARTDRRRLILDLRGNPGGDNSLNAALVRALIRTPWVSEPGALFVLIDGGTFSAAMNLAEDLERWLPAVFVGSGTGARPNTYGDARKLVLPRSGLTVRLSSLYWQNHPKDERAAIEPLVPAVPSAADVRSGVDPASRALGGLETTRGAPKGRWHGSVSAGFRHPAMTLELSDSAGKGSGVVSVPDLGVESAPVELEARDGPIWRGVLRLQSGPVPMALHASDERLIGWIDYRGNLYPFVLSGP